MKEQPLNTHELQLFSRRDLILKSLVSIPFLGMTWRLWNLQILEGKKYKELSQGNRIRLKSVAAPRGIIFDREGETLVKNIPSFNLVLTREDCPDLEGTLSKISSTLKIPLEPLQKKVKDNRHLAKFRPIELQEDLTWYQLSLVNAYQEEFPGISIEVSPRRFYPMGGSAVHMLGYMSKITESQMKVLPEKKLMSAQMVGQDGIERIYNEHLIGTDGGQQVEVNASGRVIRENNSLPPLPGEDIELTINIRLQKKIEELLGDYSGGVVIMNPNNGEILSMVSAPGFDPNDFSMGISPKKWKELTSHPLHPLNNRCTQGVYSPGSTFKMIVAGAGLELGLINEETTHFCDGTFTFNRDIRYCWKRSGHGDVNATQALESSCNVFFYKLAVEIGVDRINQYAHKFGLGKLTEIRLFNEKSGIIPSKAWKRKRFKEIWYPGETLPVGIGQGYVTVTPLQLVNYTNILATGHQVPPRIVKRVFSLKREEIHPENLPPITKADISQKTLQLLRHGMFRNVNGDSGTGGRARSKIVEVAGKTGTTQVISRKTATRLKKEQNLGKDDELERKYRNHAWFTGFAPYKNPQISFSVLIEHGSSSVKAAALTRKIIDYYFGELHPEAVPPPSLLPTTDQNV